MKSRHIKILQRRLGYLRVRMEASPRSFDKAEAKALETAIELVKTRLSTPANGK